jgi:hypothetical protein
MNRNLFALYSLIENKKTQNKNKTLKKNDKEFLKEATSKKEILSVKPNTHESDKINCFAYR